MENLTEESVLDLSKLNTIPNEIIHTIHRPKRLKFAEDQIVPATNEEDIKTINSLWSVPRSFTTTSSSTTGSSIDLSPFSTYEDSIASPVFSNHNNSSFSSSMELPHQSTTPEFKETNSEMLQKESESEAMMSNLKFYSLLEPLQEKIQEASMRIQALINSKTEAELETEHPYSLFTQFKTKFTPHMEAIQNAVEIIPKVLATPTKNYIEIGDASKTFKICQASFEKAVSKYSIKEAAIALVECDTFLPKSEKLQATIGRTSSSTSTGKQLKPLETAMLTAIYKIIADKSKMVNIQRMEGCQNSSPDFLTLVEQKMVREALSQYFNQLRQREKRNRIKIDCHSDGNHQKHCDGNIN